MNTATITFHGGAGTVTGANFLLDTGNKKILIDCGARERENHIADVNLEPFPYNPRDIDVLIITHAHQDHIGRVPRLVAQGFTGRIYSTSATRDLTRIMFADALNVMLHEQELHGSQPLYDAAAVEQSLLQWDTHEYHETFTIGDGSFTFLDAGHVLGSAMIRCERGGRVVVFTGDLGNSPDPLLPDTEPITGAHYLVMESVYGDRVHEDKTNRLELLADTINIVERTQGTLLIPSFSLERTQIILFEIKELLMQNKIAHVPVYLDAPLAIRLNTVYKQYAHLFNTHVQDVIRETGDAFDFTGLKIIHNTAESIHIHKESSPKIIIAGAGMSNGGRIRAHELQYLPDSNAYVMLVGYQAPGSLGRRIQDGASNIFIDKTQVRVRAHISALGGFSGHRDRDGLLQLVETAQTTLKTVFVAMGEPKAELFIAQRIRDFLGLDARVPQTHESTTIEW